MTIDELAAKIANDIANDVDFTVESDLEIDIQSMVIEGKITQIHKIVSRHLKDFAAQVGESYRQQKGRVCDD